MACTIRIGSYILNLSLISALLILVSCAPLSEKKRSDFQDRTSCVASAGSAETPDQHLYQQYREGLEKGLFFNGLIERFGHLTACSGVHEDGDYKINYQFGDNTLLKARFTPGINYVDHRIELTQDISHTEAIRFLQLDEKDLFDESGCGIDWSGPPERENLDVGVVRRRYRGNTCNCQGYIESNRNGANVFGFRSAC